MSPEIKKYATAAVVTLLVMYAVNNIAPKSVKDTIYGAK